MILARSTRGAGPPIGGKRLTSTHIRRDLAGQHTSASSRSATLLRVRGLRYTVSSNAIRNALGSQCIPALPVILSGAGYSFAMAKFIAVMSVMVALALGATGQILDTDIAGRRWFLKAFLTLPLAKTLIAPFCSLSEATHIRSAKCQGSLADCVKLMLFGLTSRRRAGGFRQQAVQCQRRHMYRQS